MPANMSARTSHHRVASAYQNPGQDLSSCPAMPLFYSDHLV